MRVSALIAILQTCDPEALVVVDGYEGGVCELERVVRDARIELNANDGRSYCGPHEIDAQAKHKAVYLPRSAT